MDNAASTHSGGRSGPAAGLAGSGGFPTDDGVDYETAARFFDGGADDGSDPTAPALDSMPAAVASQLSSLSDFRISFALTDVASVLKYVITELNLTKAHMAMLGARAGNAGDALSRAKDLDVAQAKLSDDVAALHAPDGPLATLTARLDAKDEEIATLRSALAGAQAAAEKAAADARASEAKAAGAAGAVKALSERQAALEQASLVQLGLISVPGAATSFYHSSAPTAVGPIALPMSSSTGDSADAADASSSSAAATATASGSPPTSPTAGSLITATAGARAASAAARRWDDLQRQLAAHTAAFNAAHQRQQEYNGGLLHQQLDTDKRVDTVVARVNKLVEAAMAARGGGSGGDDESLLPGPSSSSSAAGAGFSREDADAYLRAAAEAALSAAASPTNAAAVSATAAAGAHRRMTGRRAGSGVGLSGSGGTGGGGGSPHSLATSLHASGSSGALTGGDGGNARDVLAFAQNELAALKRRLQDAETRLQDVSADSSAAARKAETFARAEQFQMLVAQITGLLSKQGRHEDELVALRQRIDGEVQLSGPLDMSAMRRSLIALNAKQRQAADKVDTLSALVLTTRKQVAQQGSFESSPLVKSLNLRLYEFEMKFNEMEDKLTLLAHYVAKLKPTVVTAAMTVLPQGHTAVGSIVASATAAGAAGSSAGGVYGGAGTAILPGSAKPPIDARLLDSNDPDAIEGIHLKLLSRFTVRSGSDGAGAGDKAAGGSGNSVHRNLSDLARDIEALSDLQAKLHDARELLGRLNDLGSLEARVQSLLDLDVPQRLSFIERKFNTEVSFLKAHLASKVDQGNIQILLARIDALAHAQRPALAALGPVPAGAGTGAAAAGGAAGGVTASVAAPVSVADSIFAGPGGAMDPVLSAAIQRGRSYAVAPRPPAGAATARLAAAAASASSSAAPAAASPLLGFGSADLAPLGALDPAMQRLFALLSLKAGTDAVDKVEELARAFDRQNRDAVLRILAEIAELRHAVSHSPGHGHGHGQQQHHHGNGGQQHGLGPQGQGGAAAGPGENAALTYITGRPATTPVGAGPAASPTSGSGTGGGGGLAAVVGSGSAVDFLAGPIEKLQQQMEFLSVSLAAHDAALQRKCDIEMVEDVQHTMLQKVLEMCELKDSKSVRRASATGPLSGSSGGPGITVTSAGPGALMDGASLEVLARLHTHVEDLSARLRSHKEWILRNSQDVQALRDWVRYAHDVLQTQAHAHPAIKQLEQQLAQLKRRVNGAGAAPSGLERLATTGHGAGGSGGGGAGGFQPSPRMALHTPLTASGRAGTAAAGPGAAGGLGGSSSVNNHYVTVNNVNFMQNRYSMLSSKPLDGFKCMSCDRPLETLDKTAPPALPTQQLPRHLTSVVPAGGVAGDAVRVRIVASHSPERSKDEPAAASAAGAGAGRTSRAGQPPVSRASAAAPTRLPQI